MLRACYGTKFETSLPSLLGALAFAALKFWRSFTAKPNIHLDQNGSDVAGYKKANKHSS